LIFVGYGPRIFSNLPQIKSVPRESSPSPLAYFLLLAIMVVALIALIVLMERGFKRISVKFNDGTEAYIPLKITTAGIIPTEWTYTLIMLPSTLLFFLSKAFYERLSESLVPTGAWYFIVYSLITICLYYLFTSFFYNPNKMTTFLKNKQASVVSPAGRSEESYIDRNLEFMVPIAAVYLCAVIFVPNAILGLFFFFHIDSIGLITAVAILMDVTKEMRLRREGNHFGKVAELHDVPMAGFLKSLLEQKGVPCSLRGYYHRALLYFFGPYIEISVLVPEDRVVDAREVVEKYFDPGVLTVPRDSAPSPFPSPTRGEGDNGGKDD